MSNGRGGGGGGRGGRGGGAGGAKPLRDLPWQTDPNLKPDLRPSELFPAYQVPDAAPLTELEEKQLSYFLQFRQSTHDGPLYTQTRTAIVDPSESGRTYGHEQAKKRYGVKSKATVDPFWAVPMYAHRFIEKKRALPDLSGQHFVREFFPDELQATLAGEDGLLPGARSGQKNALRPIDTRHNLGTADVFDADRPEISDAEQKQRALEALDNVREDQKGGEDSRDGEDGKEGEGSDDEVAMEHEEEDWAIGRYDEDMDLYEEPDVDANDLEEEEGEGDYEIQQHFEEDNDDDDGRYDAGGGGGGAGGGGDYDDGGEGTT